MVGAANEQLPTPPRRRPRTRAGILYAPDYVVNAGGLLSMLLERGETDWRGCVARTRAIGDTLAAVLDARGREGAPPFRVADRMAEERIAEARTGPAPS